MYKTQMRLEIIGSSEFSNSYGSEWYHIPIKCQKVLHIMQVRSNRPSILTAAGLYEMKIESFGIVCNHKSR